MSSGYMKVIANVGAIIRKNCKKDEMDVDMNYTMRQE